MTPPRYEPSSPEKKITREKIISPEQFNKSLKDLQEIVAQTPMNIVIADATGVGAGHRRQGLFFEELCRLANLEKFTTHVSFDMAEIDQSGPLMKFLTFAYSILQNYPHLYQVVMKAMDSPNLYSIIDEQIRVNAPKKPLLEKLLKSPQFDPKKPTLFITTFALLEEAATLLLNEKELISGGIIATIPDPWQGQALLGMTAPDDLENGKHLTIVHNQDTLNELKRIRPHKKTEILPLGTASDPYFFFENQEKPMPKKLHLGIEFSGNQIPKVDQLILDFLPNLQKPLSNDKIRLTIHVMNHKETKEALFTKIKELGLFDHVGNDSFHNIRIIYSDDLEEAIRSRMEYIRGSLDKDWPAPDIVFSKGGEVPLEDRGNHQLIVGIYGGGHESRDIETGVKEKKAVDFRQIPIENWYHKAVQLYEEKKYQPWPRIQSLALLAPIEYLQPGYIEQLNS